MVHPSVSIRGVQREWSFKGEKVRKGGIMGSGGEYTGFIRYGLLNRGRTVLYDLIFHVPEEL